MIDIRRALLCVKGTMKGIAMAITLQTQHLGPLTVSDDYAATLAACANMAERPDDLGFMITLALQDRTLRLLRADRCPDEAAMILADVAKKFPKG
jgi:hypothetical protein